MVFAEPNNLLGGHTSRVFHYGSDAEHETRVEFVTSQLQCLGQ
jgi:hypothetical protein